MKTASITILVVASTFWAPMTHAAETEGAPLIEPLNREQLHVTWRNLSNEHVIFPLQMKDMPVKLGSERQLFLDNYLIGEAKNVTRQVHRPIRDKNNPVFAPPKADRNHAVVQHVLKFDTSPRFRMWYWSLDGWQTRPNGQRIRFANSYAISDDGIHWKRPDLNLHKVEGLVGPNNVVLPYGLMQGLFHDPEEPNPLHRFKALVCVERKNPTVREGYYLHTSPDGIHWKGDLSRPIIPSLTAYGLPQNGIGDTTRFWRDPIRKKYIGDVKFVIPGKLRCRGVMESDDLIHWTRPIPTFMSRETNSQIYGHRGFAYQGLYVGMRWIFLRPYSKRHSSYVELDCSRDGRIWTRVGAGQPFMAFNPNHDTWDATIMRPVSMLEVKDELWVYYFGAPTELESNNPKLPEAHRTDYAMGLARLKRDRFVSINGGSNAGTLTTRPLNFHGSQLHVNASVATGGHLRVGLLNADGQPLPEYDAPNCQPIRADSIDTPVAWNTKPNLAKWNQSQTRLQFHLKDAKLFSFWID